MQTFLVLSVYCRRGDTTPGDKIQVLSEQLDLLMFTLGVRADVLQDKDMRYLQFVHRFLVRVPCLSVVSPAPMIQMSGGNYNWLTQTPSQQRGRHYRLLSWQGGCPSKGVVSNKLSEQPYFEVRLLQRQAGSAGPQGGGARGRELIAAGSADSWRRAVQACVLKTVTFLCCRHHSVSRHP